MTREIGRVIVRFAYVEHYLQGIICMILDMERGIAKLALREPNATDRLELIFDLLAAKKIERPQLDYKMMKEALEDAQDIRNVCAHCAWIWSEDYHAWTAVIERGQWAGIPKADRARRSKRLFPEGQIIRLETLQAYVRGLDALALMLRDFQSKIEVELKPSQ